MTTCSIPNPATLNKPSEIADVISRLKDFERVNGTRGVVVKRQNLSYGVSYDIIAETRAKQEVGKWHGPEIYLNFWQMQYFIDLQAEYK